jgi:hypothetical protein
MPIDRWTAVRGIVTLAVVAGCALTKPVPRTFEECLQAGYPVMESFPRRCAVPGGPTFAEPYALPPEITPVPESPERLGEPTGAWAEGYVVIEGITAEMMGGNPTRVGVRLRGSLGDPCTRLFPIRQRYSDHHVSLEVRAWQQASVACIAVIEPLDLMVMLKQPLTAGTWTLEAGGVSAIYQVPGFDD